FPYDVAGAVVLAGVRQRVAEERRVADMRGDVLGCSFVDLFEAPLEQLDRPLGGAERRVGLREVRVEVRAEMRRRHVLVARRGLELLDGLEMAAALRGRAAERYPRPDCRRSIARAH